PAYPLSLPDALPILRPSQGKPDDPHALLLRTLRRFFANRCPGPCTCHATKLLLLSRMTCSRGYRAHRYKVTHSDNATPYKVSPEDRKSTRLNSSHQI